MGSPVTGAHVGFLGIRLKVNSSTTDADHGCKGSQGTLFPDKN